MSRKWPLMKVAIWAILSSASPRPEGAPLSNFVRESNDDHWVFFQKSSIDPRDDLATEVLNRLRIRRVPEISDEEDPASVGEWVRRRRDVLVIRNDVRQLRIADEVVDQIGLVMRYGKAGVGRRIGVQLADEL